MQSPRGQRLLEDCGLNPQVIDTFVLIEGQSHFTKSDAILKVATYLSGYHIIAKSRYDVFGKRQTCMIPSKELLVRFLE
jgi:predicted DCC family thiol-disulfide oxidoreductase YuxK